jgi:plasmid stabilization system protein ParE
MRRLRFTAAALENLADIAAYIAEESGHREVAERFTDVLRETKTECLPGHCLTHRKTGTATKCASETPMIRHARRGAHFEAVPVLLRLQSF